MKKSTANLICVFFDLFAVVVFYFAVCRQLNGVFSGIEHRSEFIRYTNNFYIGFICIAIPVLHIIGLIETYFPKYFNRSVCTKVFYGSFILFLIIGFVMAAAVKQLIIKNGYSYCEGAAIHTKLLRKEIYVLEDETCRQLTLERQNRNLLRIN